MFTILCTVSFFCTGTRTTRSSTYLDTIALPYARPMCKTVADSLRTALVRETGHFPVHYFPREDVRTDLLQATDRRTECQLKGEASYWTLKVGRSEEHTSELQSLMRISYAVFCLKKQKITRKSYYKTFVTP